jgi:mannose-6-phosphate isomerase-like protein (cupin superfamily)
MDKPVIAQGARKPEGVSDVLSAAGQSFEIHEWSGSGPGYLHVHYADDEAWHVLEGSLTFRFADRQEEAPAGTTVFVPAGVAHDYFETAGPTRYLIIMTPRLSKLVEALHQAPFTQHAEVMRQFESAIVEQE